MPLLKERRNRRFIKYHTIAPILRALRNARGQGLKNEGVKLKRFNDRSRETFFGYFDICPLNANGRELLAHSVESLSRQPGKTNVARIGFFRRDAPGEFVVLDETSSWCWQMGARLRWFPNPSGRQVAYSKPVETGQGTVVRDIDTGAVVKEIPYPLFDVAPDGKWGLSTDMERLEIMRPGYGYEPLSPNADCVRVPEHDGVMRVDLESGEARQIISLHQLAELGDAAKMHDAWHYVNCLSISPHAERIFFLHIWLRTPDAPMDMQARVITARPDGSELTAMCDFGLPSHICWQGDDHCVVFNVLDPTGSGEYSRFHVTDGYIGELWPNLPKFNGHQTFSPDGRFLLTDSYPDKYFEQQLLLFGEDSSARVLGRFKAPPQYLDELRCDLHPRWSVSGTQIIFDSTHDGSRAIYVMELDGNA